MLSVSVEPTSDAVVRVSLLDLSLGGCRRQDSTHPLNSLNKLGVKGIEIFRCGLKVLARYKMTRLFVGREPSPSC